MCGGFVLAIDRPGRVPWRRVRVQGLFHLGKAATYVVLGGVAGLLGAALVRAPWFSAAQVVLAVVAGVLMVLAGLQLAQVLRDLPLGRLFGPSSPYGRAVRAVTNLDGGLVPFLTGALAGLLPCPLVYAFLAFALQEGSILPAMGVMALLALTSLPALVLVVLGGAALRPETRGRFVRLAGAVVVVLGVVTVLRGAWPEALHAFHG
jgi:sulfite exporter TauE/SafE